MRKYIRSANRTTGLKILYSQRIILHSKVLKVGRNLQICAVINCIFIGGPTGSGKTNLSILLAKHFNCDIISADSRQIYQELNIGVAKPNEDQLDQIKHHFISSISIHQAYSAGKYEHQVLDLIEKLSVSQEYVIITGGTGLFLQSILHGLDSFPEVQPDILNDLNDRFREQGLDPLVEEIQLKDAEYAKLVDLQNSRRVIRALSVIRQSGKAYSSFLNQPKRKRPFQAIGIKIETPREILYARIDQRVDEMMEAGLMAEAKKLFQYKNLKALQTVGYAELFEYFAKKLPLEEAIIEIKKNTRRYAKRQITWLKKYFPFPGFPLDAFEDILKSIEQQRLEGR